MYLQFETINLLYYKLQTTFCFQLHLHIWGHKEISVSTCHIWMNICGNFKHFVKVKMVAYFFKGGCLFEFPRLLLFLQKTFLLKIFYSFLLPPAMNKEWINKNIKHHIWRQDNNSTMNIVWNIYSDACKFRTFKSTTCANFFLSFQNFFWHKCLEEEQSSTWLLRLSASHCI